MFAILYNSFDERQNEVLEKIDLVNGFKSDDCWQGDGQTLENFYVSN